LWTIACVGRIAQVKVDCTGALRNFADSHTFCDTEEVVVVFEAGVQQYVRGVYGKSFQFFQDVRSELRKVTFPNRKETIASTAVVVVVVFIIAIYLGMVDFVLSMVLGNLLN
jgi:preprotein translocase subunit SecE